MSSSEHRPTHLQLALGGAALLAVGGLAFYAGRATAAKKEKKTVRFSIGDESKTAPLASPSSGRGARVQSVYLDEEKTEGCVVVIDPISTGAVLAHQFMKRGFQVVCLWSQKFPDRFANFVRPDIKEQLKYLYSFNFTSGPNNPETWEQDCNTVVAKLRDMHVPVQAVIAGAETGVEVCDAIALRLGLPNNGASMSKVRRDKFLMGECVRNAGIRAVQQARVRSWEDCENFLKVYQPAPFAIVIKPSNSAGTDGVTLCKDRQSLKIAFEKLFMKENALGLRNTELVIQEYLLGKEYVVDSVSRFGMHKICAIWEYDKRFENGHNFIYFGMRVVSATDPIAKALVHYQLKVLNALNIVNSPGHAEIIMTQTGPCLVEVGARPHGGEGLWTVMARKCFGYTQVSACISSLVSPQLFKMLPDVPVLSNTHAMETMLVSRTSGKLVALPKLDLIRKLPSFHSMHLECHVGEYLPVTIDLLSTPGSIIMIHSSKSQLEKDFSAIREMEMEGFFVVEPMEAPVKKDLN